jgi:SAM-dependent methyltransferase
MTDPISNNNAATDPNAEERDAWNGESGQRWVADADRRDRVLEPVGRELLAAAALAPGERVLDIGCGCGVTTFAAADAVVHGRVTGLDISDVMLDEARSRLAANETHSVDFVQADAQTVGLSEVAADIVMSRFGTMFFADHKAAFANIATSLRDGGRLCIVTWRGLAENEWLMVPGMVLAEAGALPDVEGDGSGMFAQADPDVLAAILTAAGFTDVTSRAVDVDFRLGQGADDALDYLMSTGIGRRALELVPEPDQAQVLADVAAVLNSHIVDDELNLGGGILITTAVRRA